MKNFSHYARLFFFTFLAISTNLFGQKQNSYKFVEPNISISYDSNYFKNVKRYSNTFYETEAYDFSYYGDTSKKVTIHIKADHPIEYPPKRSRDSLILAGLDEIRHVRNDSFVVVTIDKDIQEIGGFSCVGLIGFDKVNKRFAMIINCYHFSDSDNTEITLISNGNDLESGYKILHTFISGFKSYSKRDIEEEELLIKKRYTVIVTPTKQIDNFKYRPKTYLGLVSVKQKLEHRISEVRLARKIGNEKFTPNEKGQVPIVSLDDEKGKIVKKGELIMLNSFGKEVSLPFSFTYINNGIF